MPKINCTVDSCSHYNGGICFANRVDIGGGASENATGTCCDSFLNKKNYSRLTNNANSSYSCDTLVCNASQCKYNDNSLCNLSSITVSGNSVQIYSETNCSSFSPK